MRSLALALVAAAAHTHRTEAALTKCQVVNILKQAGIPQVHLAQMTCTAFYESSWNPSATNHNKDGSTDFGLLQCNDNLWCYNPSHPGRANGCNVDCSTLLSAEPNAVCAAKILKQQGINAWYGYKNHKATCDSYDISACTGPSPTPNPHHDDTTGGGGGNSTTGGGGGNGTTTGGGGGNGTTTGGGGGNSTTTGGGTHTGGGNSTGTGGGGGTSTGGTGGGNGTSTGGGGTTGTHTGGTGTHTTNTGGTGTHTTNTGGTGTHTTNTGGTGTHTTNTGGTGTHTGGTTGTNTGGTGTNTGGGGTNTGTGTGTTTHAARGQLLRKRMPKHLSMDGRRQ